MISKEKCIGAATEKRRTRRGAPQDGPRILFFSGGTALRDVSRSLIGYSHNTTHVITPFDSGGSSAVLRNAFGMPAVGDIRNRLMALVDLSVPGNSELYALFTYRLSKRDSPQSLVAELTRLAEGQHVLISLVPEAKREVIQNHFRWFLSAMPEGFDLRGASIGNIVLTAGYLEQGRHLSPVIERISELAKVRGAVRAVVDADMHLAAELDDGTIIVGQHLLTGKEVHPLASKIRRVWLANSLENTEPIHVSVGEDVRESVREAELICYPVGSFYTSLVCNLLPDGVGEAIAANPCPKVFIPNCTGDPELLGHTVEEQVRVLGRSLVASGASGLRDVLDVVLVDSRCAYEGGLDVDRIESLGVNVIDLPLVTEESTPYFDAANVVQALLSFL